jgi:hypothetical protein
MANEEVRQGSTQFQSEKMSADRHSLEYTERPIPKPRKKLAVTFSAPIQSNIPKPLDSLEVGSTQSTTMPTVNMSLNERRLLFKNKRPPPPPSQNKPELLAENRINTDRSDTEEITSEADAKPKYVPMPRPRSTKKRVTNSVSVPVGGQVNDFTRL